MADNVEKKTMLISRHANEPSSLSSGEVGIADWLINVTSNSERHLQAERSRRKPRIQRASELLRRTEENNKAFEPQVVALGPFHHGQPRLEAMEEHKKASANLFIADTRHSILTFYNKVRAVAGAARECYAGNFYHLDDEAFAVMMFFDACFLLHFMDLYVKRKLRELTMSQHLIGVIIRDMFLIENQIPYIVLDALMSLKRVEIVQFVNDIVGVPFELVGRGVDDVPGHFHLLDLFRTKLLGPAEQVLYEEEQQTIPRSARELDEVGITFTSSSTSCLRDVGFSAGFIKSTLSLPPITVDDLTRSRFLNLIALELCPDGKSDYGITTYVWFIDCLIDSPEDVKELRSKGILINALGSDEHVAELFNELATDLSPDYRTYYMSIKGINDHYKNKARVSIVRMVNTHFSSPWTTISFIAAVFLLILTVIQTVFAVFPTK